jgi:hypothetical protein
MVDIPARGTVQITVTTQRRSFIAVDNVPDVPRQISGMPIVASTTARKRYRSRFSRYVIRSCYGALPNSGLSSCISDMTAAAVVTARKATTRQVHMFSLKRGC